MADFPETLAANIKQLQVEGRRLPPVEQWNPEFTGELDMRIDRQGDWFYRGNKIARQALVDLFATILKREGDDYFLVTPGEKYRITVEGFPFQVVRIDIRGQGKEQAIACHTNVGDTFLLDAEHPLKVETEAPAGEPVPFVHVRQQLYALLGRNPFYELVELAQTSEQDGEAHLWLHSCGERFLLGVA